MSTTTSISAERDQKNKALISRAFQWVPAAERHSLVNHASAEVRDAFVRKQHKLLLALVLAALAVVFVPPLFRSEKPVNEYQPKISDQGAIQSIELHETALSTSTTVKTSSGVFQVVGAVSAANGDKVTLQTETNPAVGGRKSLCIQSAVKTDCYRLK